MSTAPDVTASDPPAGPAALDPTAAAAVGVRPRWCRATWALATAVAAWWVLLAAHLVLSGHWWFWLLPDLTPPLAYIAVPLLIAAAVPVVGRLRQPLPRRPRRFVIGAGLTAVAVGVTQLGLVPQALGPHSHTITGTPIRVLSWNTEYW
ncbi:MAG: hypothetical protein HOV83_00020, partial [Catenulispora sp.]|nr:hypothetical protein [Catenulispora sp.]